MAGENMESDNNKIKESTKEIEDCLSCKLIGSGALLIASSYVYTRGWQAKRPSSKIISAVFGSSLFYMGMARFFNWIPFITIQPKAVQNS